MSFQTYNQLITMNLREIKEGINLIENYLK